MLQDFLNLLIFKFIYRKELSCRDLEGLNFNWQPDANVVSRFKHIFNLFMSFWFFFLYEVKSIITSLTNDRKN